MKAYAPSDQGTSAAVVVSQELLTAAVTGLQPTKEREKASTIFFFLQSFHICVASNGTTKESEKASTIFFLFAKYLCCQQGYHQGEKKLRQCSFYLHNILLLQSFHICVASLGEGKGFFCIFFVSTS